MPAQEASQLEKKGIALLRTKNYYVLYDAKNMIGFLDAQGSDKLSLQKKSYLKQFLLAALTVSRGDKTRGWGASQVTTSAAKKGFGPLLYDVAMAFEDGLFADRDDVSPPARKIWKFYKEKRPDVTSKPLDDIKNPKTPTRFDDAIVYSGGNKNPLNYAYVIDKMPNVSNLFLNNDYALERLADWNISEFDIIRLADEFFLERYDEENT